MKKALLASEGTFFEEEVDCIFQFKNSEVDNRLK